MKVRFWGVRGSIPTPGPDTVKVGGNTSCVEVSIPGGPLILLDAGTGLRALGNLLMGGEFGKGQGEAHFLFSHTHWDHIQGFPFFLPAYIGKRDSDNRPIPGQCNRFKVYGRTHLEKDISQVLTGQMEFHFFPVSLGQMQAEFSFHPITSGKTHQIEEKGFKVNITPLLVNHPGGSLSFGIEHQGKRVVYCTDYEHLPDGKKDHALIEHCRKADLLIYDCMYTDEEYQNGKVGWGHSTYTEGIKLCKEAGVKKFILFHHDPGHDDLFIEGLELKAQKLFPQSQAAREGLVIEI